MQHEQPNTPVLKEFDWSKYNSVSVAVIEAVAEVVNKEALDLSPLNQVLDPDGLDAILLNGSQTPTNQSISITFRFQDLIVRITSTGVGYVYSETDGC